MLRIKIHLILAKTFHYFGLLQVDSKHCREVGGGGGMVKVCTRDYYTNVGVLAKEFQLFYIPAVLLRYCELFVYCFKSLSP